MKAIRHAGITVANLKKAMSFYGGMLGLKLIRRMDEHGKFIDNISALKNVRVTTVKMAADNGNLIELLYYHSHPCLRGRRKNIYVTGLSHIAFTVKDLYRLYERLKNKGIKFNCPPQISQDGRAMVTFCRDPEGNLIELVEELI